jgi:hypothetical protein
MYDYTCELAALAPPSPELQRMFGALRENQREAERFLGTITGTVAAPDFYSEETQRQIVG